MTAPDNSDNEDQSESKRTPSPKNSKDEDPLKDEVPKTKWMYRSQKDEMRGDVSNTVKLKSKNAIKFGFPYGEQSASITLRQDRQYGFNAIFSVPRGQILCRTYRRSYFNIKFDDGPIRKFYRNRASDGSSEVSFFANPKQFLSSLKTSEQVIVEAEFYKAGRQQYVFDTRGLIWEH